MKPAVQTGDDAKLLFLGQITSLLHELDSAWVNPVRFFHENVFAGLNRRKRVERMELGGIGDQHHIRGFNHLLVSVKTGKAMRVVHADLFAPGTLNFLSLDFDAIVKNVAHGHQPRAAVGRQSLRRRARVASAASDHADFQRVAARRIGAPADFQSAQRGD
jgi:hypothetical protein